MKRNKPYLGSLVLGIRRRKDLIPQFGVNWLSIEPLGYKVYFYWNRYFDNISLPEAAYW
jgi:hypothetical protein